jgi:hypothetical protein
MSLSYGDATYLVQTISTYASWSVHKNIKIALSLSRKKPECFCRLVNRMHTLFKFELQSLCRWAGFCTPEKQTLLLSFNGLTFCPQWYQREGMLSGVGNSQLGCTKIRDSREIPKDSMRGEIGRFWPGRTRVYEDSGELPTPGCYIITCMRSIYL